MNDDDLDFRRFLHWGPMLLLGLTFFVTCTTMHMNAMWWPPALDLASWVNYFALWMHVIAILYNFVRALMVGPGFVPRKWHPLNRKDTEFLQFCQRCEGYKPPRSHHCRRCDRCVLKMDHHCPWINNCVGWSNQSSFIYFLLFFLSASVHSGFIVTSAVIRGVSKRYFIKNNMWHLATVDLTMLNCMACTMTVGVTIGMGLASIKLLHMQLKVIFSNKTEIERWIIKKAAFRRQALHLKRMSPFKYPYDLGWRLNYQEVFVPSTDGYSWPVLPGCNQFTLTVEQLEQKKDKRARTRSYKCIRPATGYSFPIISQGIWVCMNVPCNDDPRIALQPGDIVRVTRIQQYWLYGEKVILRTKNVNGKGCAIRGWFPACCATEIIDSESEETLLAGGETSSGNNKADGKLENDKHVVLTDGEAVSNEDQELKKKAYDPYFTRTLELIENQNYENLDDEKPPWDRDEAEYDFKEPFGIEEESTSKQNLLETQVKIRKRTL